MPAGGPDEPVEGLIESAIRRDATAALGPAHAAGLLSFLFADIRGYTTFTQQHGDEAAAKLTGKFAAIVRALAPEFDGTVVELRGDEALCVFSSPRQSIRFAVALQRRFVDETVDDASLPMTVGIGIDAGEAVQIDDGYRGGALNVAARLCGQAKAGEVLATAELAHLARRIEDIEYTALESMTVKGIADPLRVVRVAPTGEDPARQIAALIAAGKEPAPRPAISWLPGALGRHPRATAAGAVVLAGATVAAVLIATNAGTTSNAAFRALNENSIAALTPSGVVSTDIGVGARPVAVTSAAGSLWVANLDDESVTRIDLSSHAVLRSIPIGAAPTALAAVGGEVWVTDGTGRVSRIDPRYNQAVPVGQLSSSTTFNSALSAAWPMVTAFGFVWVVDPDGYVVRFDAQTHRKLDPVYVGDVPSAITAGAGSVWVTNGADGTVTRIAPDSALTTTIPVGHDPAAITVNAAGAWVADAATNTLVRIDLHTNAITATRSIGHATTSLLATSAALWAANGDGTVLRLDPRSGRATKTIRIGGMPSALTYASGLVWVTVAPAVVLVPASGATLHLTLQDDIALLDPALQTDFPQLSYATCANLVTYPDMSAPAGSQIVPEVAVAVPMPSDGGRTYTFTVRPGFRFSPPSNAPVTAQTFKSTIERVVNPAMKSALAYAFTNVAGYHAFVTGKTDGLSGIVARGETLTIRLAQPDGGLLANLAQGAACAVPTGTPAVRGGVPDIPSAGPYYVASQTPRQQIVLRRNPNYHGERPHRFARMVVTIGIASSRALADIEAGTADYALDGQPHDAAPRLMARYGPGSPADKAGRQQYFISPANAMRWLHMNTSRPLFANVRLRRAVNYAIDRPALVALARKFADYGPFNAGAPTDDYLPPAVTGAPDYHLYPLDGPDLRQAKQLAGRLHATAIMYTPSQSPWLEEAQIVRDDLRPLGINVELKQFPLEAYFGRITNRGEPFDLAIVGWGGGNTDPAGVLSLFDGTTITATDNNNMSYFNDPAFDRQLHAAALLNGPRRYRAYAALELKLERDYVPAAPFATDASRDFFSARIGCQVYQPVYGIDLASLCVRH